LRVFGGKADPSIAQNGRDLRMTLTRFLYRPGLPPLLFRGKRPGVRDDLRSPVIDLPPLLAEPLELRVLSKGLAPVELLRSGPLRARSGREGRSRAEPNSCLDGRSGRRVSERSCRGREKNSRSVEPARRAGGPDAGRDGLCSPLAGPLGPRDLSKGLLPVDPRRSAPVRPLGVCALSKGLAPVEPLRSGPPCARSGREGRSRAEPNFCRDGRSGRRESGRSWRGRGENPRSSGRLRPAGGPERRAGATIPVGDGRCSGDCGLGSGRE
jgi:hypothetical protein